MKYDDYSKQILEPMLIEQNPGAISAPSVLEILKWFNFSKCSQLSIISSN